MSSFASTIVGILSTDVTLQTLLTGGVHLYTDGGKDGLNRIQVPAGFDPQMGLIKPLCIVAEFPEIADNQIVDTASGYHSTVTTVVMRIYDNGNLGYGTIEAAYKRIYTLLAYKQITGSFQVLWQRVLRDRRDALNKDAGFYEVYWNVHGSMSS